MNNNVVNKVHWSFWLISILMLVWNALGSVNFFMQMNPEMVASYRETEQAMIQGRPLWAAIGFAIAVFGGTLGCVLLLLKKSACFYLFVASLVGVAMATVHSLTLNINFNMGEIIGILTMPVVVAVFSIWYSQFAKTKGWLSKQGVRVSAYSDPK